MNLSRESLLKINYTLGIINNILILGMSLSLLAPSLWSLVFLMSFNLVFGLSILKDMNKQEILGLSDDRSIIRKIALFMGFIVLGVLIIGQLIFSFYYIIYTLISIISVLYIKPELFDI